MLSSAKYNRNFIHQQTGSRVDENDYETQQNIYYRKRVKYA